MSNFGIKQHHMQLQPWIQTTNFCHCSKNKDFDIYCSLDFPTNCASGHYFESPGCGGWPPHTPDPKSRVFPGMRKSREYSLKSRDFIHVEQRPLLGPKSSYNITRTTDQTDQRTKWKVNTKKTPLVRYF